MKENRLKTIFVATIIAALLVIIITICIIFIPSQPCLAIEAVQNLTTVQFNDTLMATWSQPSGRGNCPMSYRIQLSDGAELIRAGSTVLTTFHFLNVSFAPCSPNTISVHAVTSSRFGSDIIGETNSFTHFGNIGPVTNLEVLQENNTLTASWDPPMDSEFCSLSYEVKLNNAHEGETYTTSNNAYTFEQITARPCEANTVVVIPLGRVENGGGRSLRGEEKSRGHLELGAVEDFQLERGGQTLLTSWSAPENAEDCRLSYEVTLTFQGKIRAQVITQFLHHNFYIEDIRPCSLSNVTITPIATLAYEEGEEEVRGVEIHRVHIEGLGPVVNLSIAQQTDGLLVGWDPPSGSDLCSEISYEIVLQTRDETVQESHITLEQQILLVEAKLEPCVTNIVTLTPMASISDGETVVKGQAFNRRHFGDVGAVENLVVTQEGDGLVLSWIPPVVREECPMIYKVNMWQNEDDITRGLTDQLTYAFEDVGLKPCLRSEVSVIPIVRKHLSDSEGQEARSRYFGDIGSITNFELTLNDDDQLVARWNAPIESELCALSYEMLLESAEEATSKVFAGNYFEHVLTGADLRPCAVNNVTLTPIAIVEGGVKRGLQDSRSYFGGVGPVENLEISHGEGGLLVDWVRPAESELCQVSYEVTLSFGDVVLDQIQTDVEGHTFVEANLQSCVENRVSVIPFGSNQGQETEGPEVSRGHFADLGPVVNFEVTQESNGLHARWNAPKNSDLCKDLSYEIVLKSGDDAVVENHVVPENELLLEGAGLEPCAASIVEVNPTAKTSDGGSMVTGETVAALHLADIGPVENLMVVQAEESLAVNWGPPTVREGCPLTYEVKLFYDGEVLETGVTDALRQVFENVDLRPCVVSEVAVVPLVEMYERSGEETRARHVGEIGPVRNFELTLDDNKQLTARWDAPAATELCELSYEVFLESGEAVARQVLSQGHFEHVFIDADVRPCVLHTATLTPVANIAGDSVPGVQDLRTYFTELGAVENLEVSQQSNGLSAVWDPPGDSEACIDVSYEVVLKTDDETVVESNVILENSYNFEEVDLEPCTVNSITITPTAKVSDGETIVAGEEATSLHIADIGPVEDLAVVQAEGGLAVNWAPPTVVGSCLLTYEVNLWYNEDVAETTTTGNLEHVFETTIVRPCMVVEISVTPLVDSYEKRGEEIRDRHIGEIGSVTNFDLTLDDTNQLIARWNAPVDSDLCDLSYEISLDSGDPAAPRQAFNGDRLEHVFTEANLRPCILNTVTLTPTADVEGGSVRGAEDIRAFFTGLGPVANLEVTKSQHTNGLFASWETPGESEACIDVSYEVVLKTYDEIVLETRVVLANEYDFEEANLEPCSVNVITVTPMAKISDGETAVRGKEDTVEYFADIGPVEELVLVQAEEGLAVNWAPPMVIENCPLTYEVKLLYDDEIVEADVTDIAEHVFENADLTPCAVTEVYVTPLVDLYERRGEELRKRHVAEIGAVTNFELVLDDDNRLTARWDAPIATERCELTYEVLLDSNEATARQVFKNRYFEYILAEANLRPCILNTVTLTPVANVGGDSVRGVEDFRRYFTGLGPVANLEVIQQPNGLFASWASPDESESCVDLSYEVVLKTDDDVILESRVVIENEYNFEEGNLEPCALNIITVTPTAKLTDGETMVIGNDVTDVHLADIGSVQNLGIAQAEGTLAVNWEAPMVSENCPLTFEVNLWYNGDVAETTTTDNLGHVFENADLRPCMLTEVSVVPIARKELQESKGEETRGRHIGEIGSVTNFELTLDDGNQLVARWKTPINSELCEMSYEISLESTEEEEAPQIFNQSQLEYVFSELEPRPCAAYTVTITPVANFEGDLLRGVSDTLAHVEDIGPVEDLEVNQSGESLLVTWARPDRSELCQMSYEVILSFGEEISDHIQTDFEEHNFDGANLAPCTENIVSITPTGRNQELTTQGPEMSLRHVAAVGPVRNLIFQAEPFGIAWFEPANSDACALSYQIQIDSEEGESNIVSELFYALEDVPCHQYTATVTPLVQAGGQSGPPLTQTHQVPSVSEIGPVQDLHFSENAFKWDPPTNTGDCDVKYELTVTINGESTVLTTEERVFEVSSVCSTVAIIITATVEDITGEPVELEVEVPLLSLGPVENLEFRSDRVRWEKPSGSGACPIVYKITHTSGSDTTEATLPQSQNYFLIDLKFCSHHKVTVYAFHEENSVAGDPVSIQKTIALPNDPIAIGRVRDLSLASEVLVEWQPPDSIDTELCSVVYSVTLDRGFDMKTVSQDETHFDIPEVPCSNNVLSVFPIVNGILGQVAEISSVQSEYVMVDDAPVFMSSTTDSTFVSTIWRAPSKEINACKITNFTVELVLDEARRLVVPVTDNDQRVISLEVSDLLPDTEYTMRTGIHIHEFPMHGPLSEAFTFRTEPLSSEAETRSFKKLTRYSPRDSSVSDYTDVKLDANDPARHTNKDTFDVPPGL